MEVRTATGTVALERTPRFPAGAGAVPAWALPVAAAGAAVLGALTAAGPRALILVPGVMLAACALLLLRDRAVYLVAVAPWFSPALKLGSWGLSADDFVPVLLAVCALGVVLHSRAFVRATWPVVMLFVALALTGAASALVNHRGAGHLTGMLLRGTGRPLLNLAMVAVGFLCVPRKRARSLLAFCVASAALHAALGVAAVLLPWSGPGGVGAAPVGLAFRARFWGWRATGMFGQEQATHLGAHLAMLALVAVSLAAGKRAGAGRLGWMVACGVMLAGIVATQTRTSMLVFVVGLAVLALLGRDRSLRTWVIAGGGLWCVAAAVAAPLLLSVENRRVAFYLAGLQVFARNPLLGIGPGQYLPMVRVQGVHTALGLVRRGTHNPFINAAAEGGVAAPMLLLAITAVAVYLAWQGHRRLGRTCGYTAGILAAFTAFVIHNIPNNLFSIHSVSLFVWIMMGALARWLRDERSTDPSTAPIAGTNPPGFAGTVDSP